MGLYFFFKFSELEDFANRLVTAVLNLGEFKLQKNTEIKAARLFFFGGGGVGLVKMSLASMSLPNKVLQSHDSNPKFHAIP